MNRAADQHESSPPADDYWDAGDLACGELLLELRQRLHRLAPGQVFCLVTRDAGAVLDVPAWCRVTKNSLQASDPPRFYIRRRE